MSLVKLRFWLQDYNENVHPVTKMKELDFNIIEAIPQTVGDQWWFTVETLVEPLPEYLEVL